MAEKNIGKITQIISAVIDKNDDWLNIYANYDMEKNRPCDTLELCLCKADGTEETWSYRLNAAEQDVLLRKMEEYCQQQTGMSLHDYAQQFRVEKKVSEEITIQTGQGPFTLRLGGTIDRMDAKESRIRRSRK